MMVIVSKSIVSCRIWNIHKIHRNRISKDFKSKQNYSFSQRNYSLSNTEFDHPIVFKDYLFNSRSFDYLATKCHLRNQISENINFGTRNMDAFKTSLPLTAQVTINDNKYWNEKKEESKTWNGTSRKRKYAGYFMLALIRHRAYFNESCNLVRVKNV